MTERATSKDAEAADESAKVAHRLRFVSETLCPVEVEVGPERTHMSAQVDAVDGDTAELSRLWAEGLPGPGAVIRVVWSDESGRYAVAAKLLRTLSASSVLIDLHRAWIEPQAADDMTQGSERLVAVLPSGLHDSNAYVFPVLRIGASQCEIRTSVALPPGHDVPYVEIVGDRRLLRRASAQVLELRPWYAEDGAHAFTLRLALAACADDEAQRDAHDLLTDARDVKHVLELGSLLRARGSYEVPGHGGGPLTLVQLGPSEATFELDRASEGPPAGATIRIAMDLLATHYELDLRVLAHEPPRLRTTLPLILRRRRRHRREHRVEVGAEQNVQLCARNPVDDSVEHFAVEEIAFFALLVSRPASGATLWPGLPLEQAELRCGERVVELGDLAVEVVEPAGGDQRVRCVVSVQRPSIADDPEMIFVIASLAHPLVRIHDGGDFDGLHAIYVRAGLFGPHMHRNLAPIFAQTREVWRKLHSKAADVVRTFVHEREGVPEATVTVMRAWEHAWVLQHFVDLSSEHDRASGRLQSAYLDHILPRPDCRYLLFFVKTDNHLMNAYLRRFFQLMGSPEAVARSNVELWIRHEGSTRDTEAPRDERVTVRACIPSDAPLVYRAAQRSFGTYAASALSFSPEELELPDTRRRFAAAELQRDRVCELACLDAVPVYAVIEERSTPGVNLTWMLNAAWIIPIRPRLDTDQRVLRHALARLVERRPQSLTAERFLNLPTGLAEGALREAGFEREAELFLYVLNRSGLHRLLHYTAGRVGEVDAVARKRRRRKV